MSDTDNHSENVYTDPIKKTILENLEMCPEHNATVINNIKSFYEFLHNTRVEANTLTAKIFHITSVLVTNNMIENLSTINDLIHERYALYNNYFSTVSNYISENKIPFEENNLKLDLLCISSIQYIVNDVHAYNICTNVYNYIISNPGIFTTTSDIVLYRRKLINIVSETTKDTKQLYELVDTVNLLFPRYYSCNALCTFLTMGLSRYPNISSPLAMPKYMQHMPIDVNIIPTENRGVARVHIYSAYTSYTDMHTVRANIYTTLNPPAYTETYNAPSSNNVRSVLNHLTRVAEEINTIMFRYIEHFIEHHTTQERTAAIADTANTDTAIDIESPKPCCACIKNRSIFYQFVLYFIVVFIVLIMTLILLI